MPVNDITQAESDHRASSLAKLKKAASDVAKRNIGVYGDLFRGVRQILAEDDLMCDTLSRYAAELEAHAREGDDRLLRDGNSDIAVADYCTSIAEAVRFSLEELNKLRDRIQIELKDAGARTDGGLQLGDLREAISGYHLAYQEYGDGLRDSVARIRWTGACSKATAWAVVDAIGSIGAGRVKLEAQIHAADARLAREAEHVEAAPRPTEPSEDAAEAPVAGQQRRSHGEVMAELKSQRAALRRATERLGEVVS